MLLQEKEAGGGALKKGGMVRKRLSASWKKLVKNRGCGGGRKALCGKNHEEMWRSKDLL